MKAYKYVGPNELLELVEKIGKGKRVLSSQDVIEWIGESAQELDDENQVITTYVIDLEYRLLIADRHSEHVVCAGGEEVFSAGEMTFGVVGADVEVTEVTNQSTGYCPEPESWPSVKKALDRAGLKNPGSFGRELIFRRCEKCGLLNVVKDDWFVCVKCNAELSRSWNIS